MSEFSISGSWGSAQLSAADQARFFFRDGLADPVRVRRVRALPALHDRRIARVGGSQRSHARSATRCSSREAGGAPDLDNWFIKIARIEGRHRSFSIAVMIDGDPSNGLRHQHDSRSHGGSTALKRRRGAQMASEPRAQRPTRARWAPPWDVRHVVRDRRPTLTRDGLEWDVKHVGRARLRTGAARARKNRQGLRASGNHLNPEPSVASVAVNQSTWC